MTPMQKKVIRRAAKYRLRKERRELAKYLNWWRKNKKPLEF